MIFTTSEMRELEERAFAAGVTAEALMDEAGARIAAAVRQFFPVAGRCVVHFGKGHNGGDALVAARHLAAHGWSVELAPAFGIADWAPLTRKKFAALEERRPAAASRTLVVLDGLLGIGAGGALREPILTGVRAINRLRKESGAYIFAIDLPTGLDGDSGKADPDTVRADFTLAIGFTKRGLVADGATYFVGRLAVLALGELTSRAAGAAGETVATSATLAPFLPRRAFDVHKGDFGRIAIVAGSRGLVGAARMTAEACVRAGGGLVTLCVTEDIYDVVAAGTAPEVMVKPVRVLREILDLQQDATAIGPGLGAARRDEILELIRRSEGPMVVDADALNALATGLGILETCSGPRLLTPHPGEMARLVPESKNCPRRETVERFTSRFPHALLLKGSRTVVGQAGRAISYNSTGSPGMATGGMGDVLTGVCAALAGRGLGLYDTARLGAWVCGRAAELAIFGGGESEESLTPSALLAHLGAAFEELRALSA